ncbi:Stk1 family PASTA domain-containing Ser/Thr kinase [Gordonia polyisoprenivorans]|uniref:Stk1 family PASTA domain-containing Ser/Thr kinase n=1 Tax=Gordonia polyisoprenivorans TaxID=84595 RepID=UPI0022346FD0|nr:Stk1 family PASTA domain-containing Ser/Thr kinase [Gordonia polyisoprenivorans]
MMSTPHHLSDRYELGETLGFGGMSEVHYARDLLLNRDVAVKVLRADLARDPSFYLRFRREAQNAAKLNHPTIVQVFDTGEAETDEGPLPFIVMEYVDGETLRDVLRRNGPVAPRQAMTWMADVAAAMDFSHRNGIVHRDMKPANVMIDSSGAVKVMDFGIARAMNDSTSTMTQTSAVMGTAQYLSPEQARGIKVDPRSDIYSMGCVLFELLTGEPPFTGDSPVAVAHQHVHEDPRWPSAVRPDIPPELDSIVMKAMSKNKENRYQSAAELRSDLIKVLAGGKPSAPLLMSEEDRTAWLDTGSGPRRALRADTGGQPAAGKDDDTPTRRRPPWLIAGAVAAVVLLFVGLLVWWSPWSSGSARKVAVPAVAGLSAADARSTLEKAGFEVKQLDESSETVDAGKATRSAPGENVPTPEGSTVTLFISSGRERQRIPDVRNKAQADATSELQNAGFTNIKVQQVDSVSVEVGDVVDTNPAVGTDTPVRDPLIIRISTGPKDVTVPNLVGQFESAARAQLAQLGLKVTVVEGDSDLPQGQVVSSSPTAGDSIKQGATVQLTISRGNMIVVPDLTGQTADQAFATLQRSGWNGALNQTPRNVPLGSPDDGKILSQSPGDGSKLAKNGAINVVVGRASLLPG